MKDILKYIFVLAFISLMSSCRLDEPFEPVQETPACSEIELVARPTSFIKTDVATKATSAEIEAIESDIHTAYFLMYDRDGRLLRYENLTDKITDRRTVPSQTIPADRAYTDVTVCYIANLKKSFVEKNIVKPEKDIEDGITTDLQKLQSAVISIDSYADASEVGHVGVPVMDLSVGLNKIYQNCLPMVGVWNGDLTGESGQTAVEIEVKRLFAKIGFTVKLDITDGSVNETNIPSLAFESFTVRNLPEKVALFPSEAESAWVSRASQFTDVVIPDSETTIDQGESVTFYFYVPEYLVEPVVGKYDGEQWYANRNQKYKPLLVEGSNRKKYATYVTFNGKMSAQGGDMTLDYKVYLGGNNFDDFSLKRNYLYNNLISIHGTAYGDGAFGIDHRVNISYEGGFMVGFQRATLLDSHFEVRPLRVKFHPDFIDANKGSGGTLTVEVLNADSDEGERPDWLRLERPTKTQMNASGAPYCSGPSNSTKRKYFTTDLVTATLKDSWKVSYNPFASASSDVPGDLNGDIPVWVYIDEFGASTTDDFSADEVRNARIRVTYTPAVGDPTFRNFSIQQRKVYPVVSTNRSNYTYGIEFFEEYLHDYDSQVNYDSEGGEYHTSEEGIEWGLDGVQLSRLNQAVYLSDITSKSSNALVQAGVNAVSGAISSLISSQVNEQEQIAKFFYDFYLERDPSGVNATVRDYSGIDFNKEIINQLSAIDESNESVNLDIFLNGRSKSVIEYCYNKNKRNADGSIDVLHWYAPAIDEIEDITISAYEEFDVFQDKLYWSCQPSFNINKIDVPNYILNVYNSEIKDKTTTEKIADAGFFGEGQYLSDDIFRARATKVNEQGQNVSSGVSGDDIFYNIMLVNGSYYYKTTTKYTKRTAFGVTFWTPGIPSITSGIESITVGINRNPNMNASPEPGNLPRSEVKNRVRCVYSPEGISLQ